MPPSPDKTNLSPAAMDNSKHTFYAIQFKRPTCEFIRPYKTREGIVYAHTKITHTNANHIEVVDYLPGHIKLNDGDTVAFVDFGDDERYPENTFAKILRTGQIIHPQSITYPWLNPMAVTLPLLGFIYLFWDAHFKNLQQPYPDTPIELSLFGAIAMTIILSIVAAGVSYALYAPMKASQKRLTFVRNLTFPPPDDLPPPPWTATPSNLKLLPKPTKKSTPLHPPSR